MILIGSLGRTVSLCWRKSEAKLFFSAALADPTEYKRPGKIMQHLILAKEYMYRMNIIKQMKSKNGMQ